MTQSIISDEQRKFKFSRHGAAAAAPSGVPHALLPGARASPAAAPELQPQPGGEPGPAPAAGRATAGAAAPGTLDLPERERLANWTRFYSVSGSDKIA